MLADPIRSLSEFMRQCLQSWSTFITDLRDNYHGLNYFTINQIQFINQYISNTIHQTTNQPSTDVANFNFIRAILSNICPDFTADKLKSIYTETLSNPTSAVATLAQITKGSKSLDSAWSHFMATESLISDQSVTLKHLAVILNTFSQRNRRGQRRKVPGYLNRGEPSLITCLPVDQITTVLSMYAYDIHAPLPCSDEVLFCDASTTYEELEIFLRRVFSQRYIIAPNSLFYYYYYIIQTSLMSIL